MDGLFELMFIGIFVLASIFDAVARNRRKKRRMEEMEREESEGATSTIDWEHSEPEETAAPSTPEWETRSGDRETADTMVPDDLWAVLTGQERASGPESDAREESRAARTTHSPVPGMESEPVASEPHIPVPVPTDRYADADPGERPGIGDAGRAIGRWEIGAQGRREVRPPARDAGSLARRPVAALDDSIASLRSRTRGASPYTVKLRRGGRKGLREAVVLSEVMGPPVALRPRGGGWDGEGG